MCICPSLLLDRGDSFHRVYIKALHAFPVSLVRRNPGKEEQRRSQEAREQKKWLSEKINGSLKEKKEARRRRWIPSPKNIGTTSRPHRCSASGMWGRRLCQGHKELWSVRYLGSCLSSPSNWTGFCPGLALVAT